MGAPIAPPLSPPLMSHSMFAENAFIAKKRVRFSRVYVLLRFSVSPRAVITPAENQSWNTGVRQFTIIYIPTSFIVVGGVVIDLSVCSLILKVKGLENL